MTLNQPVLVVTSLTARSRTANITHKNQKNINMKTYSVLVSNQMEKQRISFSLIHHLSAQLLERMSV